MRNRILATLILLGFIALLLLFMYLVIHVKYFIEVVFVLATGGAGIIGIGLGMYYLWLVIYDSLKD